MSGSFYGLFSEQVLLEVSTLLRNRQKQSLLPKEQGLRHRQGLSWEGILETAVKPGWKAREERHQGRQTSSCHCHCKCGKQVVVSVSTAGRSCHFPVAVTA